MAALDKIRIFVCYSREETEQADQLVQDLIDRNFDVKIDRRDLPYGYKWQQELAEMLRDSDAVVWLISTASITSKWCNWELGEAQRTSKRLLPIKIEDVDPDQLPNLLGSIHLLPAQGKYDRLVHLDALCTALSTDRDWIKEHTRLTDRATEWQLRNRSSDRLLRGKALADAENWRDTRPAQASAPNAEVLDLITESRRASATRSRATSIIATSIAAVMTVAMGVAVWQYRAATVQQTRAENEADTATIQREVALGRLGLREQPLAALGRITQAAEHNRKAAREGRFPILTDLHSGLFEALAAGRERPRLRGFRDGLYGDVHSISQSASSDDNDIADRLLIGMREQVLLTDMKGRPIAPPIAGADLGLAFATRAIWLGSREQAKFAVATGEIFQDSHLNIGVGIYDREGKQLARTLTDNPYPFLSLGYYNGEKKLVLAGDTHGNLFAIDEETLETLLIAEGKGVALIGIAVNQTAETQIFLAFGKPPPTLIVADPSPQSAPQYAAFSADDAKRIAGVLGDPKALIYAIGATEDDQPSCLLSSDLPGSTDYRIFTCDNRGGVSIWNSAEEKQWPPFRIAAHVGVAGGIATAIAYSPELKAIAIGDQDGTIQIFTLEAESLSPVLRQEGGPVTALAFVDKSKTLLSAGNGTSIRQWDISDIGGQAVKRVGGSAEDKLAISGEGHVLIFDENSYSHGRRIVIHDRRGADESGRIVHFPLQPKKREELQLAIAADGNRAAWIENGVLSVVDLPASSDAVQVSLPDANTASLLTLSSDGRYALVGMRLQQPQTSPLQPAAPASGRLIIYKLPGSGSAPTLLHDWPDETGRLASVAIGLAASAPADENLMPLFITGDDTARLRSWTVEGKELWQVSPPESSTEKLSIQHLAAAHDSLLVVMRRQGLQFVGDAEAFVGIWSLSKHEMTVPLVRLKRIVQSAFISDEMKIAAIAGQSGRIGREINDVLVFDAATLRLLSIIPLMEDYDHSRVLWSDDGGSLRALTRFMRERNWRVGLDPLIEVANRRLEAWKSSDRYDALVEQAHRDAQAGKTAEALEKFRAAASMRNDVLGPWLGVGNNSYNPIAKMGNKEEAADAFDRALRVDPFDVVALVRRGRLHYFSGEYALAENDYAIAARVPMTYIGVPKVYASFVSMNIAMRKLAQTMRRNVRYEPLAFLGYSIFNQRRWKDAENVLTELITTVSGSARDFELRATARAMQQNFDDALADAEAASSKLDGDGGAYSGLDEFKSFGDTPAKRAARICALSNTALTWLDGSSDRAADSKSRVKWLQRTVAKCSEAWQTDPVAAPQSQMMAKSAHAKLSALQQTAPLPKIVALSPSEMWAEILQKPDARSVEDFKTRYSGYPEAADAGRWLARASAKGKVLVGNGNALIYGRWQTADGGLAVSIEPDGHGGQIWRNRDPKNPSFQPGDVVSETRPDGSGKWTNVGRHKWGPDANGVRNWGEADALVIDLFEQDELFYAYLDSRYRGGWTLKRVAGE